METLSFEGYRDLVVEELDLEAPEGLGAEASLETDLSMDSFTVFELIVLTERLADLAVPPAELPPLVTLGDAYSYYLQASSAAAEEKAD